MTCQHLEEFLSAYLDGESEEEERKGIEEHLTSCIHCQVKLEEERMTKALLEKKVPWVRAPQTLRSRIMEGLDSPQGEFLDRVRSIFTLNPFPATATAIMGVVIVVGILLYLRSEPPLQAAPILIESVNDHISALSRHSPVEFTSSNPEEIVEWFRGRVSIPIHIPSYKGMTLVGSKVCHFSDRRVASLSYNKGGQLISLFMCEGSGIPLKGMKEKRVKGRNFQSGSHMGYNGLFWRDGDILCFIVAPLANEELVLLASGGE